MQNITIFKSRDNLDKLSSIRLSTNILLIHSNLCLQVTSNFKRKNEFSAQKDFRNFRK